MDNTRLFLWLALFALLWLNYTAWIADREPPPQTPQTAIDSPDLPDAPGGVADVDDDLPALPAEATEAPAQAPDTPAAASDAGTVTVRTDVLDLVIDLNGGDLVGAVLLDYPVHKDRPDELVRLLDNRAASRWVMQTGLLAADGGPQPDHQSVFRASQAHYELAPGADELVVALDWVNGDGVQARKIYTFRRGRYDIHLTLEVSNAGNEAWRGAPYAQMRRLHDPVERSYLSVDSYSFTGPVLYDGEQSKKLDFEDLARDPIIDRAAVDGWLAGIQHHFLAAVVPPRGETFNFRAIARGQDYVLSAVGGVQTIAPQSTAETTFTLFVGPKLQSQLEDAGKELELTVDYGVLTILAQPLFWLLSLVHGWVGNWGWSIIIVTLLIKLAFYKLTETSGRSMAKMRKIGPRLQALQERYKDDREARGRALMELYKKEKINPAAGCLPILVQMPFFFAFYWVLIESVEMRQAPFMLWINDLSSRDPYFVLPLLMGAAMFFQTRLNPTPPDPVQARVMQIMPIVFSVFFAFFPAGLVLYWLTNTLVSIAQQWRINKIVAREG